MRIDVLTLFPGMFAGVLSDSILKIAQEKGRVKIRLTDIRDFTADRHRKVDDTPYGGGPGMVMACEPVFRAVEAVDPDGQAERVLLTPQGERLDQARVKAWAATDWLLLICGRYEGFDERIRIGLGAEEISIGDYVLSGGEIPAMVLIDTIVRRLPGVLGDENSAGAESFEKGKLDFPQYTRPREFRGLAVPEVLLSGDHEAIRQWRDEQARRRTEARRPDLQPPRHKDTKEKREAFEPVSEKEDDIAKKVVHAAYTVHKALGPGLLEKVYEACFCHELSKLGLSYQKQVDIPIAYDGLSFDEGLRLDVLVEDRVICELKAVDTMNPVWKAQLLSHLRLTGKRLGLLINFNTALIKDGIQRIVL